MRLLGKVAIVTGASRGLGEHVAAAYARDGAKVVVAARTEEVKDQRLPGTIHETVERIRRDGGEAVAVRCNVADAEDCRALVAQTLAAFGRVDILVNNAAIQPPGGLSTMQPRHWELEVKVNLSGPLYLAQAVWETMKAQGAGAIINVSSVGADRAREGEIGHYGLLKVALELITTGLAAEGKPFGIAVNALKPKGAVDTPGLRFAWTARGATIPETMPGPEDFAEAAVILATATPQTFTGHDINDEDTITVWGRGGVVGAVEEQEPSALG
jgi:citronellol/citronellal dehydrogenase